MTSAPYVARTTLPVDSRRQIAAARLFLSEERTLEPIVDPWVEEYESAPRSRTAAESTAPVAQGDLYMDRAAAAQADLGQAAEVRPLRRES